MNVRNTTMVAMLCATMRFSKICRAAFLIHCGTLWKRHTRLPHTLRLIKSDKNRREWENVISENLLKDQLRARRAIDNRGSFVQAIWKSAAWSRSRESGAHFSRGGFVIAARHCTIYVMRPRMKFPEKKTKNGRIRNRWRRERLLSKFSIPMGAISPLNCCSVATDGKFKANAARERGKSGTSNSDLKFFWNDF